MVLKPQVIEDGGIMLLQRHIDTIPYFEHTLVTSPAIRIRPNLIKNIILHISATVTTLGGGIPLNQDYPWRIIQNITVRSVRNEILKSIDPRSFTWLNTYERGTPEYSTFPAIFPAEASADTIEFDFCIPFENFTGLEPEKTILNTNEFTEIYIDVLWGDVLDAYTGIIFDPLVVTCTIVPLEREPVNMSDELEPRKKMIDQTYKQAMTSTSYEYLLPEATLIKTILVMINYDNAPSERVPGPPEPLLQLSIEDDDNAHSLRQWSGGQIKSANKMYYGLEAIAEGIYVIEFDQLRDLSTLYKTFGRNYPKLKLEFNPAVFGFPLDPTTISVLIRQIATPPAIVVPVL